MGIFSWMKRRLTTALIEARGIEKVVDNIASLANHSIRMHKHGDVDDLKKAINKAVKRYAKLKDAKEKQKLMEYVFKETQEGAEYLKRENDDMVRIFHETIHVLTEMRDTYGNDLYQNINWLERNELSAVDAQAAQNIKKHYQNLMSEIEIDLLDYRRGTRRQKRRRKTRGKARWFKLVVGIKRAEAEINQDADEVKKIFRSLQTDFRELTEAETIDVDPKLVEERFIEITSKLMEVLAYLEEIVLDYFIVTAKLKKEAVEGLAEALRPVSGVDPITYKRLIEIPKQMDVTFKTSSRYAYKGARRAAKS